MDQEKIKEGQNARTVGKARHGFGDSLNYPISGFAAGQNDGDHQRIINLTNSVHDLSTYGRRLRSILHLRVTDARHFDRYTCRMNTHYGKVQGHIRVRNKGEY